MQFTDNTDKVIKVEMTILVNKLLSLVDQTKKDLNMSRWIHMPRHSEEYKYYKLLCGYYEAFAYNMLGGLWLSDTSDEGKKVAIGHYEGPCYM
jgi:hypothetical protein